MADRFRECNFNCTIQELKQLLFFHVCDLPLNFNCTIQELKRCNKNVQRYRGYVFQLHHTGIKTGRLLRGGGNKSSFQLHHTGIKTRLTHIPNQVRLAHFNCTIQELKPMRS